MLQNKGLVRLVKMIAYVKNSAAKAITNAVYRLKEFTDAPVLQLAPQITHMNIDCIRRTTNIAIPHGLQKLCPRHHSITVLQKVAQKVKLLPPQYQGMTIKKNLTRIKVNQQSIKFNLSIHSIKVTVKSEYLTPHSTQKATTNTAQKGQQQNKSKRVELLTTLAPNANLITLKNNDKKCQKNKQRNNSKLKLQNKKKKGYTLMQSLFTSTITNV